MSPIAASEVYFYGKYLSILQPCVHLNISLTFVPCLTYLTHKAGIKPAHTWSAVWLHDAISKYVFVASI